MSGRLDRRRLPVTASRTHKRPPGLRRFAGAVTHTRIELAVTDRVGVDRADTVPIATGPDRGRVVISLGPAADRGHALPDLQPGDRLEAAAELEVALDNTVGPGGPPRSQAGSVGVPYGYTPGIVAGLRLVAGSPEAEAGAVIATGRAMPLRLTAGQRWARLLVEDAFRIGEHTAAALENARVELVISASHEDARPGHVLLLGGGPNRRDRDRAGQISVARLRPGSSKLPAGDETKQLRATELPATGVPRSAYSLPLPGLRRGEQLLVHSCLRANSTPAGRSLPVGTRLFLADSPTQAEPDERSYAALISPAAGRVVDGGLGDCQPGAGASSYRDVGVVRIRENAVRPVYLNVAAVAGEPGDLPEAATGAVDLVQGGWLNVVRIAPTEPG